MSVQVEVPLSNAVMMNFSLSARNSRSGNAFLSSPQLRRPSPVDVGRSFKNENGNHAKDARLFTDRQHSSPSGNARRLSPTQMLTATPGGHKHKNNCLKCNCKCKQSLVSSKSSSSLVLSGENSSSALSSSQSRHKLDLAVKIKSIHLTAVSTTPSKNSESEDASSTEWKSKQPADLEVLVRDKDSNQKRFFLLDCRPFIPFNLNHISGALNLYCADRCSRRRLTSGKTSIVDMVKGTNEEKDAFKNNLKSAEIILYDENSTKLDAGDCKNPLPTIYELLRLQGANVSFLIGGIETFHKRYPTLCTQCSKPTPRVPLYSPTTPLVQEPAIDTATASQILKFLYLGNERDAANESRLLELGITHILNVTAHIPLFFEQKSDKIKITYRRLPASDSGHQNLKQYFNDACEFIDEVRRANGRVLIHCQAGVSRSATITIAYIMTHSTLRMHDAFHFVKARRPIVSPNFNFMGQLYSLEQSIDNGELPRSADFDLEVPEQVQYIPPQSEYVPSPIEHLQCTEPLQVPEPKNAKRQMKLVLPEVQITEHEPTPQVPSCTHKEPYFPCAEPRAPVVQSSSVPCTSSIAVNNCLTDDKILNAFQ